MTHLSFYPGEDDPDSKADPIDAPLDEPETEDGEEKIRPDEDPDDSLLDDGADGIVEGEEIE